MKKSRMKFMNNKSKVRTEEEKDEFLKVLTIKIQNISVVENKNVESLYSKIKKLIINSLNSIKRLTFKKRDIIPEYIITRRKRRTLLYKDIIHKQYYLIKCNKILRPRKSPENGQYLI